MPNFRVKGMIQLTVAIDEVVENANSAVHAKEVVLAELINYPNVEIDNEKLLITRIQNNA